MIRGDSRGRFSEDDPTSLLESPDPFERTHDTDEMFPSSADKSGRYYSQTLFGPFVSSKSLEGSGSNSNRLRKLTPKMPSSRYGASGSFDLETLSTEGADGVCTNSEGGYDETYSFTWGPDILTNWIRPNLMSFGRSRSLFSDSSRETEYSTSFGDVSDSSSLYSSSHSRPVLIGSRGKEIQRGMQRNHCGRGAIEPVDRGNGVGCSTQCPSRCKERYFSNSAALVFRGTKRKMMEPIPPYKVVKKKRIIRAARSISSSVVGSNISKSSYTSPDKETDGERVDGKKVRAREKRRRRREKNHEKYGDKHRWAFTCAFCKFHTFEDKDIEKHFGSTYHKETLDYIRRQAKFDDGVISFLHDCMVHKFRKTVSTLHKLNSSCARSKDEWPKIMEGVTEDDYMRRMEVVYCVACDTHIPVLFSSVQQHLNSLTHLKSKMAYKEQLKRDSVVTAKAIINNDNVKVRYEKYMKGEDPFAADTRDTSSDSQEQERSDEDDAEDSSS